MFTREFWKALALRRKQRACKHERWNHDDHIRTIECKGCGLRAWVDEYVDLYAVKTNR